MRRNFLVGLIICLIPTAVAASWVGWAAYKEAHGRAGFRRGIDLAGGTILVYEVNLEKTLARQRKPGTTDADAQAEAAAGLDAESIRKLAESLKRRIDPTDLRNVVVRPVGTTRVEIILPFSGTAKKDESAAGAITEDFVQEVKGLVRQVGVLEFRILANKTDDADALRDAAALIDGADSDPALKKELADRAKAGLPPRPPTQEYKVRVGNGAEQDGVTYEWTELGREERASLNLTNTPNPDKDASRLLWETLKGKRGKTHLHESSAGDRRDRPGTASMLLYSRDFTKAVPSQDEDGKQVEYFVLTRISPTDALKVDRDVGLRAEVDTDQSLKPCVKFSLNATGASRFGRMTERNRPGDSVYRSLAIILDDRVVSAPTLNQPIRESGQITGNYKLEDVNRMVYIFRSGALNAELKPEPVSENSVGPTLGQDTVQKGLLAVGLSFGAVLAFMVVYYRFAGIVACVALFANLLLTVGFMVMVSAAFTLPGLAGVVLMLGMAVDANVLIYERIREERDKGANLLTAIRLGYDRAFPTIIDTHLTSIFTAIVLYAFGNDQLRGFAISLTVGLVISLFTALYMTRLMFDFWLSRRWLTSLRMHQLFARPRIDFMRLRVPMFAITLALTVAGLGLFLARGEGALNVDFTKGTVYGGRLKEGQERSLTDLLALLGDTAQRDRLKVTDVVWLGKPEGDDTDPDGRKRRPAEYIYKVVYEAAAGAPADAIVTLANAPDGATEAEQVADVRRRASGLPDVSVEQVFLSGDANDGNKSRSFTVRTTEKEPDVVQVVLDRLLRDDAGGPLLDTTRVVGRDAKGPAVTLTFSKPTAPGYLKGFLIRELRLANRVPLAGSVLAAADVAGVPGEGDEAIKDARSGRFTKVRVDVGNNPEFADLKASPDGKDPKAAAEAADLAGAVDRAVTAFEARPIPDRLETFDPALAAATRNQAFLAIVASWAAILAYLWFRFGSWTFGLAAVFCLIHDLCFTLGAIAVCHYLHDTTIGHLLRLHDFKIDLPAVAALLTLVGYSVNDTIVVFDRIKEVRGKNPLLTPALINESVNGTLSRTVLASLTVFLVVGVLYWFGGEGVHLFSFVMVVGVLVGTYSSIYIASPLLLLFGEGTPKAGSRLPATAGKPAGATA